MFWKLQVIFGCLFSLPNDNRPILKSLDKSIYTLHLIKSEIFLVNYEHINICLNDNKL